MVDQGGGVDDQVDGVGQSAAEVACSRPRFASASSLVITSRCAVAQ